MEVPAHSGPAGGGDDVPGPGQQADGEGGSCCQEGSENIAILGLFIVLARSCLLFVLLEAGHHTPTYLPYQPTFYNKGISYCYL